MKDSSRREFMALSASLGLLAAAGARAAGGLGVRESEVSIRTPDGECDAAFFRPETGSHPGVLFWADAFGLRPVTRDMGRRLASAGYSVLVPNPFYRIATAAALSGRMLDFGNPDDRARLQQLMGSVSAAGNAEKDAAAFVGFLDAQPAVSKQHRIGAQGYCMGGALVMRSCATLPARFGAGASFHGGGLVTDKPDSPHLLLPKIKAQLYFGIAASDDEKQPDAKTTLRSAWDAAGVKAEIEVYAGTLHGWCMADMPSRDGKPTYDRESAERAWGHLLALYRAALA